MVTKRVLLCFVLALGMPAGSAKLLGAPLLPDIIMEIPNNSSGDHPFQTTSGGQPILKFTTWTVNLGAGALELHCNVQGSSATCDQWVFDSGGGHTSQSVGTFTYDTLSNRVRFNDSADYFLKEVTGTDGNGVGGIVGANEKVAYCIVDSQKYTTQPPGTPNTAHYTTCSPSMGMTIMGISVGWVDSYPSSYSTQIINLTGISSGTYWLENIGDPLNRLVESNESNNAYRIKVTITTNFSPEIGLIGNGQPISNNDSSPTTADHTDFGYVDVASGATTRTFTIQNTGTGTLSLTGAPRIQIIGSSDFAVSEQPSSPVAVNGGTVTFHVSFDPSTLASQTATVSIVNNDGNENPYQFVIRGNTDLDNDGLPDGWETQYNVSDPNADDDGDGFSNEEELIAGTHPRDAASLLKIKEITCGQNGCEIIFDSLSGRSYQVEYRENWSSEWMLLEEKTGTGSTISVPDLAAAGEPQRLYRLSVGL